MKNNLTTGNAPDTSKEALRKIFPYGCQESKRIGNKTEMFDAVYSAYRDMTPRHFGGIGKKAKERDEILRKTVDKFCDYFNQEPMSSPEKYDNWHRDLSRFLHEEFDKIGYGDVLTRGKAQKLINMSMKNFYFYSNSKEEYFQYAHFTLDRFTLIWYGVHCPVYDFFPDSWEKWGKFDDTVYEAIQQEVRKYLDSPENTELTGVSPFKAEFFIWEEYKQKFQKF